VVAGQLCADRDTRYDDDQQSCAAPSPPPALLLKRSAPRA
jgi:hypothetical protein